MNVPGFTAEASIYRSRRHYQSARMLGVDSTSYINPAQLTPPISSCPCPPGWSDCFPDSTCASGSARRRLNCDCSLEPKQCCPGGFGWTNCGDHSCPPGTTCSALGCCPPDCDINCGDHFCPPGTTCSGPGCCPPDCCPAGAYACSDGDGCCPDGWYCGSLFGWHFCIPSL
jgi:hypothetical protein